MASHEVFNRPAMDIRTTAQYCYFDIALPGVTDKTGIKIHWQTSQSFMVEGEIPRPRLSFGNESNDEPSDEEWENHTGQSIVPPNSLMSLGGAPTHTPIETIIDENEAPTADTAPMPKDQYPGFSHLIRCPGSGTNSEHSHDDTDSPTNPTSTHSHDISDGAETSEVLIHGSPPMDEIALIHMRTNSSKTSSYSHRPHNDHDVSPTTRRFSFLPRHHDKPAALDHDTSDPSYDTLEPVENTSEPRLLLSEIAIGSYKRCCTVPNEMEIDVKSTRARLDAGILTVRVPRCKNRTGAGIDADMGWDVIVD